MWLGKVPYPPTQPNNDVPLSSIYISTYKQVPYIHNDISRDYGNCLIMMTLDRVK